MASDCIVPVAAVSKVREHPNADMLSVVEVLGYQMVSALIEDSDGPLVRKFISGKVDERGKGVPAEEGAKTPTAPVTQARPEEERVEQPQEVCDAARQATPQDQKRP